MPDHKGFKLQQLVNFQKFSTVRVNNGIEKVTKLSLIDTTWVNVRKCLRGQCKGTSKQAIRVCIDIVNMVIICLN